VGEIANENFTWIQPLYLKPLPIDAILYLIEEHKNVIVVEDGSIKGGVGETIKCAAQENNIKSAIHLLGVPDDFVPHGSNQELYKECGFSPGQIKDLLL